MAYGYVFVVVGQDVTGITIRGVYERSEDAFRAEREMREDGYGDVTCEGMEVLEQYEPPAEID